MKIPKGERVWVNYLVDEVVKYIITSREMDRALYFLYKVDGEKFEKISKAENPMDFDAIIFANNITAFG